MRLLGSCGTGTAPPPPRTIDKTRARGLLRSSCHSHSHLVASILSSSPLPLLLLARAHKHMPMATSQAASSGSAAAIGGTTNAIGQTIAGLPVWKIDGFSATKDLGVGKSIKSSTFNVGGHGWYIECYPCGVDEESAGWVSLFLCLSAHKEEQVQGRCEFYMVDDDAWSEFLFEKTIESKHTFNADTLWRCGSTHTWNRTKLESRLNGDCFQVGCVVYVAKEFPVVPPPDLHRPLSDLVASGLPGDLTTFQVGGELFTLHRGLPGPSALVAASPASAGATTAARISADIDMDNVAGSHVLTIDGYSNAKKALILNESLDSERFVVGGRWWYMGLYPSVEEENNNTNCLAVFLHHENEDDEDLVVKVRFELTLLTLAREIISSAQVCYAFTYTNDRCRSYFPFTIEPQSSLLLGDSFHVKCDVTIVREITPMRLPDLHLHFGSLLASQVGTDVTFDVSGDLFSAHKCVLATRSTAFMAEFFGPARKGSSATVTHVQIDDMEPRVFKALLHFIYTDTLPEVRDDDDKIMMAQGLLVAADRYAMERLKLICGDMLCSYINDARTAITILDLADKHGCPRLREACKKFLMDNFAKDAP